MLFLLAFVVTIVLGVMRPFVMLMTRWRLFGRRGDRLRPWLDRLTAALGVYPIVGPDGRPRPLRPTIRLGVVVVALFALDAGLLRASLGEERFRLGGPIALAGDGILVATSLGWALWRPLTLRGWVLSLGMGVAAVYGAAILALMVLSQLGLRP